MTRTEWDLDTYKLHGSTLNTARLSGRTVGIRFIAVFFGDLAIISWIAVNEDSDSAGFLSS